MNFVNGMKINPPYALQMSKKIYQKSASPFTVKILFELATPVPSAGATGQADPHRKIQTFFPADMAGKK